MLRTRLLGCTNNLDPSESCVLFLNPPIFFNEPEAKTLDLSRFHSPPLSSRSSEQTFYPSCPSLPSAPSGTTWNCFGTKSRRGRLPNSHREKEKEEEEDRDFFHLPPFLNCPRRSGAEEEERRRRPAGKIGLPRLLKRKPMSFPFFTGWDSTEKRWHCSNSCLELNISQENLFKSYKILGYEK